MTDPAWRERKIRELIDDRHALLHHKWNGVETARHRRVRHHIERELDFYEMQEAEPGFAMMRERLRKTRNLLRRVNRAQALATDSDSIPPSAEK